MFSGRILQIGSFPASSECLTGYNRMIATSDPIGCMPVYHCTMNLIPRCTLRCNNFTYRVYKLQQSVLNSIIMCNSLNHTSTYRIVQQLVSFLTDFQAKYYYLYHLELVPRSIGLGSPPSAITKAVFKNFSRAKKHPPSTKVRHRMTLQFNVGDCLYPKIAEGFLLLTRITLRIQHGYLKTYTPL